MPAGTFAVVRYIPDPARDEPINVGIIATGPAGAVFRTDDKAWARIRGSDMHVDPDTLGHAQEYLEAMTSHSVLVLKADGIHEIQPWDDSFCQTLAD